MNSEHHGLQKFSENNKNLKESTTPSSIKAGVDFKTPRDNKVMGEAPADSKRLTSVPGVALPPDMKRPRRKKLSVLAGEGRWEVRTKRDWH